MTESSASACDSNSNDDESTNTINAVVNTILQKSWSLVTAMTRQTEGNNNNNAYESDYHHQHHHQRQEHVVLPIMKKLIIPYFLKTTILIILFGVVLGHAGSNLPRKAIGVRPGTALPLWRKVIIHLCSNIGVKGYDNVLGSYSPPIVCSFYFAVFVFIWLIVLVIQCFAMHATKTNYYQQGQEINDIIQNSGMISLMACVIGAVIYNKLNVRGVSYPGDERRGHKALTRKAQFQSRDISLDKENRYWHCVVAEESHTISHTKFNCVEELPEDEETKQDLHCYISDKRESVQVSVNKNVVTSHESSKRVYKGLSGESFGRQIWISAATPTHSRTTKEDENTIFYYANGGKSYQGFNPATNPNSSDVVFRQQQIRSYLHTHKHHKLPSLQPCTTLKQHIHKACHFYSMLQCTDGHWAGDYGGPHFLLPGLVFSWYIMKCPSTLLDKYQCSMIIQYLLNHQQTDGGWGTHIESPSTMFGTVLSYVSLRLLGYPASQLKQARAFIQNNGTALQTSSWAKFWLCLLGLMDWKGHNVIPPEMWLLPAWFPFHPARLWCHCRMVYLPMGYLYAKKFVYPDAETDDLIRNLRNEIYTEPYCNIQWSKTRNLIADFDNYSPISTIMEALQHIMYVYEQTFLPKYIRPAGIQFCEDYMTAEDLQTNYINIGPVNKVLNMLSAYLMSNYNTQHVTVQNHIMRCHDYLWLAEDGMKMQGYNGSQCWDTCFAIQAMKECNMLDTFPDVSTKVWKYLEKTQILSTNTSKSTNAFPFESPINRCTFFRHVSLGGWPFSTSAHGWPIR